MKKLLLFLTALFFHFISYSQKPVVSSFTPASGPVGTSITIAGNNFSSTPSNNIVYFGAVKGTVLTASATGLTVTVPTGASFKPITVTVNGLTGSSAQPFIVTFPGGNGITTNCFQPKIDSTTDLHPNGVAAADFDGDGKVDLATPNNYSTIGSPASISILQNTGSTGAISFAPHVEIATGVLTYAIAAGDLNGDGKPDLVSCSIVDKTISVLKNTSTPGSISFAARIDLATGDNPYSIAIADLDDDGKPDIAVVNNLSATLSVYLNTGTGGNIAFAPKSDFVTASGPCSIASGDLDGDGKPDLAVANELSNSVSVFRNTSTTGIITLAAKVDYTAGTKPCGIAIGDLNGDNKADIAVSNNTSATFSVYKNNCTPGTIAFSPKADFGSGASPYLLNIGDINGDGKPDVVIGGNSVSLKQNFSTVSTFSFGSAFLGLSPTVYETGIADLDGDGKDDLAGALFSSNRISLLRNRNNEPFLSYFTPTTAAAGATVVIIGENFSGITAVSFGGVPAGSFVITNSTRIDAVVGSGVSGNVSLTNAYGVATQAGFVFAGPPVISAYTPATAGTNQVITITGNNFNNASNVSFGGTPASSFTVVSPTTITAVVGSGASGNVSVTTTYGTVNSPGFTYLPLPAITTFSPASAASGTNITITGVYFTGATAVNFGGVPASSYTINSDNSITAVVGSGATGNISITTPIGTGIKQGFTFIPAPSISSCSPMTGQTGSMLTLTGTNFTGATLVRIGNVPVNSFTILSPTTIQLIVGSGSSGNITVSGPGGTGTLAGFTFIGPPLISSVSSLAGVAGSTIIINGSGFSASSKVRVGTVNAKVTTASASVLTALVPETGVDRDINVFERNLNATSELNFKTTFPGSDTGFNSSSFAAPVTPIAGGAEKSITADMDGDGLLDILIPDIYNKKIAVYRNLSSKGAIAFAPKMEVSCFWLPTNIIARDIDGDGKPDIIAGNQSYSNTLSVFRNTSVPGNLSFDARTDFPTLNSSFMAVACGDLDGDGRYDIAVKTSSDSISVFKNNSLPGQILLGNPVQFYIGSNGSSEYQIFIHDVDGDKKPEIIASKPYLLCIKNNSTLEAFAFSSPASIFPSGLLSIMSVTVSDLDNDGKADVAAIMDNKFSVFRNQSTPGNISFTENIIYNYSSGTNVNIISADLNGDGKEEIVLRKAPFFYIFNNQSDSGSVAFLPPVNYPASTFQGPMETGDLDGDNKMELIVFTSPLNIHRNLTGNKVLYLCSGAGTSFNCNLSGSMYQWQQNTGSGFANITDNASFSGTQTASLSITAVPSTWYGYTYRCQVNGGNYSNESTVKIRNTWTGATSNAWENPANWSCGQVPDNNTDVIINSGSVVINVSTTIRSLEIKPGVSINIAAGVNLTVLF